MINSSLREFANGLVAKQRIGKSGVRVLERDLLRDGAFTWDQAELLLRLDRSVKSVHPCWTAYLLHTIVDFAVWGARPTGRVDSETTERVCAALSLTDAPTCRALRIAAAICAEAEHAGQDLSASTPAVGLQAVPPMLLAA